MHGYIINDVWGIVLKYLLYEFDYDVKTVDYGFCMGVTPSPVFHPETKYFYEKKFMAFTVYSKNPGTRLLCDSLLCNSLKIYFPFDSSVKFVVISPNNQYILCITMGDFHKIIGDWVDWLFTSTAVNELLIYQ